MIPFPEKYGIVTFIYADKSISKVYISINISNKSEKQQIIAEAILSTGIGFHFQRKTLISLAS